MKEILNYIFVKIGALVLFISLFQVISCTSGNEANSSLDDDSRYDKEYFTIQVKKTIDKDVVVKVGLNSDISHPDKIGTIGFDFEFFNYGGNIRIFKSMRENVFISGCPIISCVCVEPSYVVSVTDIHNSDKYGQYNMLPVQL